MFMRNMLKGHITFIYTDLGMCVYLCLYTKQSIIKSDQKGQTDANVISLKIHVSIYLQKFFPIEIELDQLLRDEVD